MNLTYLIINLVFTAVAAVAAWPQLASLKARPWLTSLLVVGVMTLVFDNLIVGLQIVGYNATLIAGLRLGYAPLEDFGYLITGSFLIPALWQRFAKLGQTNAQIGKD
jgi:lycopene cyclase domain-containing protein